MIDQELLDFLWIDILPAADDHVLDPADDLAEPFLIELGDVAAVHEAVAIDCASSLFRLVPIAQHDRITARAQLAGRADGDRRAGLIDELAFEVRLYPANRRYTPRQRIVGRRLEADWT